MMHESSLKAENAKPSDPCPLIDGTLPPAKEREGIRSKLSKDSNLLKVVELCKRRGFVYPSSEIYGGFASAYDYGPLGTLMANNIKREWTKEISLRTRNVVQMDSAIVSHPRIWEASGHTKAFNDPLVEDKVTHVRYRADKLIEDTLGISTSDMTFEDMQNCIEKHGLRSPVGNPLTELKTFNLLVEAQLGSTRESKESVYLRGETCQGIFVNFNNLVQTGRVSVPFGVLQIGKAFRNEITARQFIVRTREFEQMEFEYFFDPQDGVDWFQHWSEKFLDVLDKRIGLPKDRLRLRMLPQEEMAHYAKRAADIEFNMRNGDWLELSPMNHRGDWDLTRHAEYSGTKMDYFDQKTGRRFTPNIIETSFGVGRMFYTLMDNGFHEEAVPGEAETRTVLKLHPNIAPYQCAILPLSKKAPLTGIAENLFSDLAGTWGISFDESGSIGKRYRRQDEIGTPFCLTIDHETPGNGNVTIRHRDTMKQDTVSLDQVKSYLGERLR